MSDETARDHVREIARLLLGAAQVHESEGRRALADRHRRAAGRLEGSAPA